MKRVNEPTVKSEREESVWANTEYEGKGGHSIENPPENIIYIKDSLQIKEEDGEASDCIKKEVKDELEVGLEGLGAFGTEERDHFPGCVEGDLTEVDQISSTCTGMPEVLQTIKVETQDGAELNGLALEAGLDAADGKTVKPEEEEWCQVESSRTSSVEWKYERIFRKKFGCVKDPAVRHGRLNPDTTVPVQRNNPKRKLKCIKRENAMLDPMTKSLHHGPNVAENPGRHLNNKDGSTELKVTFPVKDICDQLSGKTFYESNVKQHSLVKSKETQFPYNHCSYVTNSKDELHICLTQNKEKMFACDQCSFRTSRKPYLKQHYLVHSKEKLFACEQCSYKTNHKNHLSKHCLSHDNFKKFACNQCSYMTNIKGNLTKHHLSHSSLKNFACDQCSYMTNIKGNLTKHCLVHSSLKNFACDQCSYTTNIKGNLTKHCLIHSNFKKFACDQCSYKTNDRSHLTRHCLTHEIF